MTSASIRAAQAEAIDAGRVEVQHEQGDVEGTTGDPFCLFVHLFRWDIGRFREVGFPQAVGAHHFNCSPPTSLSEL